MLSEYIRNFTLGSAKFHRVVRVRFVAPKDGFEFGSVRRTLPVEFGSVRRTLPVEFGSVRQNLSKTGFGSGSVRFDSHL